MLSKILTSLLLVGGASALSAGPVYSCGGGSACNGNLYAVWVVSQTATSYVLDVGIQVTDSYTGSKSDFLDALAVIPDNSSSFTGASLTGNPAGIWSLKSGGLNTGGCSGSGAPFICAGATGMGTNLFTFVAPNTYAPKLLVWQFTLQGTPPSLGDTAHIKYHYIDSIYGATVGSLGSFDIAIQCIGGNGCGASSSGGSAAVPEPVTSALIGSGLIGLYFIRRRFPR